MADKNAGVYTLFLPKFKEVMICYLVKRLNMKTSESLLNIRSELAESLDMFLDMEINLLLVYILIILFHPCCVCFARYVEGPGAPYHHDRYADRSPVVHLRLGQGLLPLAPPTTTRDASLAQSQTGKSIMKNTPYIGVDI